MSRKFRRRSFVPILAVTWIAICWLMVGGADTAVPTTASTSTAEPIDFARDVVPIFQSSCISCHANGLAKGGFRLDTRELVLKGGDSGYAALIPGHGKDSPIVTLVSETDPTVLMPKKGTHLTPSQISTLTAWIDQGAVWPAGVQPGRFKEAALAPRRPAIPPAAPNSGLTNSIDLILQPYFADHGMSPSQTPVDDRLFARRIYLDTTGLLPSPEDLNAFVGNRSPDKRAMLIHRLLGDDRRYAEHWMSFWNDLLRNDYRGTGYIDGGRKQITAWLFNALKTNMPYDEFVRELVTGVNGSEGFTNGIVWRGTVNASQQPTLQAAQNISQVFMGVNLKCASCHDSFVSNWKLADAYGLAGVFSDRPLEMQRCDHPLGTFATGKFLYPELGTIDFNARRGQRISQLASIIVSSKNGRLTRTIVNRLWQKTMGRALIEPTDEMDNDPWNADLLDQLAVELSDHDYDLKQVLFSIFSSRAYQLPAVAQESERDDKFVFKGPLIRRMSAEMFTDAVSSVTGIWQAKPSTRPAGDGNSPEATDVRAVLCPADPLMTALGRPNREQVVTERATAATTLQALEMTNGSTLASTLQRASTKLLMNQPGVDELIDGIYQRALGRPPTIKEMQSARDTVSSPPTEDGVEDLMWAVFMLPEFQLIR